LSRAVNKVYNERIKLRVGSSALLRRCVDFAEFEMGCQFFPLTACGR